MPPTRTTHPGRRSLAISTAVVTAFAATACGSSPDPDYQGVCVDRTTQQRVDDRDCDNDTRGGHGFFFFPIGARFPGLGQNLRSFPGSVTSVPDGHNGVKGGAASTGGTATKAGVRSSVSRGGFGTTSHKSGWSIGG